MWTLDQIKKLVADAAQNQPITKADADRIIDSIIVKQYSDLSAAYILQSPEIASLPESIVYYQAIADVQTEDLADVVIWAVAQRQMIKAANDHAAQKEIPA